MSRSLLVRRHLYQAQLLHRQTDRNSRFTQFRISPALGKILSAEAGQQKEKIQSGNRGTERKNGGCASRYRSALFPQYGRGSLCGSN